MSTIPKKVKVVPISIIIIIIIISITIYYCDNRLRRCEMA